MSRMSSALLLTALAMLGVGISASSPDGQKAQQKLEHWKRLEAGLGKRFRAFIDTGTDADEAKTYYKAIGTELGTNTAARDVPESLDDLMAYLGYSGISAADLEAIASDALMDPAKLATSVTDQARFNAAFGTNPLVADDILSTRYFAPKITDVSEPRPNADGSAGEPSKLGWRKLVVLRARPHSGADDNGIEFGYILFNMFKSRADVVAGNDPYLTNHSVNTQAILTRKGAPVSGLRSAYFLDYGPDGAGNQWALAFALNATFDARDPAIAPNKDYFVPVACSQCHGDGDAKNPQLAYLDTDHWYDRVQPGDDFPEVKASRFGALFDGGKEGADGGVRNAAQYKAAMDVVRKINGQIRAQNNAIDAGSFHVRAVDVWRKLHTASDDYAKPILRAFDPISAGERTWSASKLGDEALLTDLNRYCFRCHVSINYSVFDKQAFWGRARTVKALLGLPISNSFHMPQDRLLSATEIQRIRDEIDAVLAQP